MKQKILLFESRQLCYESNTYFMNAFEEALNELGQEVQICDLSDDYEEQLENLLGIRDRFYAAIDFNSLLPRMITEEGTPYLDCLGVPFYNYLVDHPLYHHPGLSQKVKEYHAICIDERHSAYIRQFYPHIKSVNTIPLGGMKASYRREINQRRFELLYLGTYIPLGQIHDEMNALRPEILKETKDLILRMQEDIDLSQEEALEARLKENGEELNREEFARRLNENFLADRYIRYERRRDTVLFAAKAEVPFTIVGHGWENLKFKGCKLPDIKSGVRFGLSLEVLADAKVLLNTTPAFYGGIHDRVFSAMVNGVVCFTEGNDYTRNVFHNQEEVCFYDAGKLDKLAEQAELLCNNSSLQEKIIETAYKRACREFTFKERAKELLQVIL